MRIWIVGQKWLAAETLRLCLQRGHELVGVTAPAADTRLAEAARVAGVTPTRGVSADAGSIAAQDWCRGSLERPGGPADLSDHFGLRRPWCILP